MFKIQVAKCWDDLSLFVTAQGIEHGIEQKVFGAHQGASVEHHDASRLTLHTFIPRGHLKSSTNWHRFPTKDHFRQSQSDNVCDFCQQNRNKQHLATHLFWSFLWAWIVRGWVSLSCNCQLHTSKKGNLWEHNEEQPSWFSWVPCACL